MTNAEASSVVVTGPLCIPCRNGKEGWGVYPGVSDVLYCNFAGSACVLCVQGRRTEIKESCAYYSDI